jgi:hypothetical protein
MIIKVCTSVYMVSLALAHPNKVSRSIVGPLHTSSLCRVPMSQTSSNGRRLDLRMRSGNQSLLGLDCTMAPYCEYSCGERKKKLELFERSSHDTLSFSRCIIYDPGLLANSEFLTRSFSWKRGACVECSVCGVWVVPYLYYDVFQVMEPPGMVFRMPARPSFKEPCPS